MTNTNTERIPIFKTTKVQIGAIIFTMIYLLIFFYWMHNHLPSSDPIPQPLQISQKDAEIASNVEIGLFINNFPTFSFEKSNFIVDGILWFKFPRGAESLKTLENFSIANLLLNGNNQCISVSSPIIRLIHNDVFATYAFLANFTGHFNQKNFPMGDHTLSIIVQNKTASPYELNFTSRDENLVINKENLEIEWVPHKLEVKTGYFKAALAGKPRPSMEISYPVSVFTIHFKNTGIRDLASLYFPLLLIFFIILFCLLLDITDVSRLSYIATAVPILVLFRMVIDQTSPSVGYNTHIDYFFYLLVFLSLVILLFQIYVVLRLHHLKHLSEEKKKVVYKHLDYFNSFLLIATLFVLIVMTTLSYWR
jgi:hypothetical protein